MPPLPFRNISLTDRDRRILRGLYESRLITLPQAADIYFDGKYEAAKKRFQKLEHARMLAKRPGWKQYDKAIYTLTPPAFRFLVNNHEEFLHDYPKVSEKTARKRAYVKESTVRHELSVMDVKSAMHHGIRSVPHCSIAEFITWPRLIEFETTHKSGRPYTVFPDGFLRLQELDESNNPETEAYYFLEVDLSTEARSVLSTRVGGYLRYQERNGLAGRFGYDPSGEDTFYFRVLIVSKTEERRNCLADYILRNNVDTPPSFVWLTTLDEVRAHPIGTIWMAVGEYFRVTQRTPFDPYAPRSKEDRYITNPEREQMVANSAILRSVCNLESC